MKKYFYMDGSNSLGPFSIEELQEKKISRETHVWFHELGEWKEAGVVPELNELFTLLPPPFLKQNKELNIALVPQNMKTNMDIFIFIAIAFWFFNLLVMFVIQKLVDKWYEPPVRYIQIGLNIIFVALPIIFALSIKDKSLKKIALVLGAIISIYMLYNNISYLFI
jgi:hypothetical protein